MNGQTRAASNHPYVLSGRELLRTEEKTFCVEGLAKGAYFVRITSDGGTAVRKLIVR